MSQKIKCPHCEEENYATDTICMGCGRPLQEKAAPEPKSQPESQQASVPKVTKRTIDEKQDQKGMPLVWRILLISVVVALAELAITRPATIFYISFETMQDILAILLGALLYGGVRGLVLYFLLQFAKWPAGVAALIGAALAFGFLGPYSILTILVGLIVGYAIGVITEQER